MGDILTRLAVSIAPALFFLSSLIYLDSYKLLRFRAVLSAILVGGAVAAACYPINVYLMAFGIELPHYSRYLAPPIEEMGKALVLFYLIRRHKIGFLVDAAIFGFAVGTGFGVIENTYYLKTIPHAHLAVWIIRGFGTAIMHGGATAICGILSKVMAERHPARLVTVFVPGLVAAMAVHSLFNHFLLSPLLSTALILLALPPLVVLVFRQSELALRRWLDMGLDADAELLALIHSGRFTESKVGRYLHSLKERFRGEVVADMLCYLRLHVELSLQAKGLLMMRNAGFRAAPDEDVQAKFEELRYLDRSIGRTGKRAMLPFLRVSGKELWQLYLLGKK